MTYRNKTDLRLEIPNVGVVEPHGTIDSESPLENQHLELVEGQTASQPDINAAAQSEHEGGTE